MKKLFLLLASAFCLNASAAISTDPADFPNNHYVDEWGRLKLDGKQLCAEDGTSVQLKGWSTFGTNFSDVSGCIDETAFKAMKAWGANIVRIAMYPHNENGAWTGTAHMVPGWIDAAAKVGIYILIDWHVLYDNTNRNGSGPSQFHTNDAKQFFTDISSYVKSKGYKHVLYELCNEPHGVSWSDIKDHCNQILPILSNNDPGAVVIIGTPEWDQQVSQAAASPITNNMGMQLMYSFHLYAGDGSHMSMIDTQMLNALSSVPVFVSEWGSSAASGGGGGINIENSDNFLNRLSKVNNRIADISWCYWSWGKKDEASASLNKCSSYDINNDLRDAGKYITGILLNGFEPKPQNPSGPFLTPQEIPGMLEVGYFDKGGEGVAFHDENSTTDDAFEWEGKVYCNAAIAWATKSADWKVSDMFRHDECADVTNCNILGLADGDWDTKSYNLGCVEPGEWLNYTVKVNKAGYYKIKAATSTATGAEWGLGISIVNSEKSYMNGNIVRFVKPEWLDINDPENNLTALSFGAYSLAECTHEDPKPWNCWTWLPMTGYKTPTDEVGVVFKEAGEFTIRLTAAADFIGVEEHPITGEFGSLKFEYVDGLEIHESEVMEGEILPNPNPGTGISSVAADNGIVREKFIVTADTDNKEYAKYSRIFNMMGVEVSNTNLTPGIYFGIK